MLLKNEFKHLKCWQVQVDIWFFHHSSFLFFFKTLVEPSQSWRHRSFVRRYVTLSQIDRILLNEGIKLDLKYFHLGYCKQKTSSRWKKNFNYCRKTKIVVCSFVVWGQFSKFLRSIFFAKFCPVQIWVEWFLQFFVSSLRFLLTMMSCLNATWIFLSNLVVNNA